MAGGKGGGAWRLNRVKGVKYMITEETRLWVVTHNAIYRLYIIETYTWIICNVINQCCPNKFILNK